MTFIINILGSGAALPTGRRRCSSQVINFGGFKMMIDCAEGTQSRVRSMHIKLQSIGTILISHLHGDHFFGLPGLLSTMHLCGRTEPVTVVAPRGARQAVETLFQLSGNHIDYPLNWVELDFEDGMQPVFQNKYCTVEAFPLLHSVPTYGFRITEASRPAGMGRVYSYCCDTAYTPQIIPYIEGSHMLCLECTFSDDKADLASTRLHLTASQAATLAAQSQVGTLLLSHISARYHEATPLLQSASAIFPNTVVAADGMRLELTSDPTLIKIQTSENKPLTNNGEK